MKKLLIIFALFAPAAIDAMEGDTPEQKLPGILKSIEDKFDAKSLSNDDVMAYWRLYMDGRPKHIALINFFNAGFGTKAVAYLTHIAEKVRRHEPLTEQERKIAEAVSFLIEMADTSGAFLKVPEVTQLKALRQANSEELKEVLFA